MDEPTPIADAAVARGARRAAERLAPQAGGSLVADVEAALHDQRPGRPQQYLDPISLGALIVSVASLAWTIYTDLRTQTPHPSPQVIARRVRIELAPTPSSIEPAERDRIIDVVVDETIPGSDN